MIRMVLWLEQSKRGGRSDSQKSSIEKINNRGNSFEI